jgi:hypothetical protein
MMLAAHVGKSYKARSGRVNKFIRTETATAVALQTVLTLEPSGEVLLELGLVAVVIHPVPRVERYRDTVGVERAWCGRNEQQ